MSSSAPSGATPAGTLQTRFSASLGGGPFVETWEIMSADFDDMLRMAVLISLGTDRVAADDDPLPPAEQDRRGWWADAFHTDPIGSRLWELEHQPVNAETVRRAQEYAEEALAWMVADGHCTEVVVEATRPVQGRIAMTVDTVSERGPSRLFDAADLWEALRG